MESSITGIVVSVELEECVDLFEADTNSGVNGTIGDELRGDDDEKLDMLFDESFSFDLFV